MTSTLASLRSLGLQLHLDGDRLKVGPAASVTPELASATAASKPALLAELRQEAAEDVAEFIAERTAIAEFDGNMARPEAERLAVARASVKYSLTDYYGNPPQQGVGALQGDIGDDADSLMEELRRRYGDRLLSATEF